MHRLSEDLGAKYLFFLLSFPQNEIKIYYFCSVSIFFEGSVFTFQFLNDKIHNYREFLPYANFITAVFQNYYYNLANAIL